MRLLLHEANIDKRFDTRVIERNINRNLVQADDYNKSVQMLEDDAENADYIAIDEFLTDSESRKR